MRIVLWATAVVAVLAACASGPSGSGPSGSSPSSSGPTGSSPAATEGEPTAELTIVVMPSPGQPERLWTLRCSGSTPLAGTDHPTASAACRLVTEHPALANPPKPPPDRACTQLYGGPDVATVTGTLGGQPVSHRFKRTDGCEIAAWDAAVELIGRPSGAI